MKVSVRKNMCNKKVIAKKPLTNLYEMNYNKYEESMGLKDIYVYIDLLCI